MSRRASAITAAAVGLVFLALATRASSSLGHAGDGLTAPIGSVFTRAVVGALLVLGVGVVAIAVWRVRHRDQPFGAALAAAAPWLLALCGLGALLGMATTPLRPEDPDLARRQARNPTIGGDENPRDWEGNFTDDDLRRFSARLEIDREGNRRVVIDRDGDGDYETALVPCPDAQPMGVGDDGPVIELAAVAVDSVRARPASDLVPIDNECDGKVDSYARLGDEPPNYVDEFDVLPDFGNLPSIPPPEPADPPKVDSSRVLGTGSAAPWLIGLVAAVVLGGLIWALLAARRTRTTVVPLEPPAPDGEVDFAAATEAVRSTLEMMLNDPDPRTAIIGAYGTLLDGFAAVGLGRLAHEAPEEYLHRVSEVLDVDPAGFATLTKLFAIARYSTLPMGPEDREAAIAALRSTMTQLQAARAPVEIAGV